MFELLALIGLIFIIAIYLGSPRKGDMGENRVSHKAKSFTRKNSESESFDNVILKTPDGTTQIDHIIISPYGIFVIETKNLNGWIFGSENQRMWTQTFRPSKYLLKRLSNQYKFQFQNPLRQNYKHMKAVQNFLNVNMSNIFSVVVFTGDSEFKSEMPDNVIELYKLPSYLNSFKEQILSIETVEKLSRKMTNYLLESKIDETDHVENVINNLNNPICPKCGSQMVLRTAKKGRSAGSQFWGCRNFPSCKVTKNIN